MANPLVIEQVVRTQTGQMDDVLEFCSGVNVVVGPPNTGKTGWLRTINYVLGSDERAEDAIGEELAAKYDTAAVTIRIGQTQHTIRRQWKELGTRTKVFVDDEAMPPDELGRFLLEHMGLPVLHYPQGNPFGQRTWPELSWRSLYRHMYRRQKFWADLADQQPECEQHACILQFAGLARFLYSDEYGRLVQKQKRILELQAKKDQFVDMLQEVSKDILDEPGLAAALTPESLATAVQQTGSQIQVAAERRERLLRSLAASVMPRRHGAPQVYERVGEDLAQKKSQDEACSQRLRRAEDRLCEVLQYQQTVEHELVKLRRVQSAGDRLANLKVTHCPACDQEIHQRDDNRQVCYVCGQRKPQMATPAQDGVKRLGFEVEQLEAEFGEASQLVAALKQEVAAVSAERTQVREAIRQIEQRLRPLQAAAAYVLPPEVSYKDREIGRLQERVRQLQRIQAALAKRETINRQIEEIQSEISCLDREVATQAASLDFDRTSDDLTDGVNTYLNAIKAINGRSWTLDAQVRFQLREKGFKITVGNQNWKSKLGGTLTLYFVIAYQYSLMQLQTKAGRDFPGLLLLDFPAQLEDGTSVADKENFVLEPFVGLCKSLGPDKGQVIAMGSAFENLDVAKRIELTTVWQ